MQPRIVIPITSECGIRCIQSFNICAPYTIHIVAWNPSGISIQEEI